MKDLEPLQEATLEQLHAFAIALIKRNAEMRALLEDLEWSGSSGLEGEDACCPDCLRLHMERGLQLRGADERGHAVTCRLSKFLILGDKLT